MKKLSKPRARIKKTTHVEVLELPVEPDFVSLPPDVPLEDAFALNEQAKDWFPQSLPTPAERLARKVDVEFVL